MHITCPHCGTPQDVPPSAGGQVVACFACGGQSIAPVLTATPASAAPPPPSFPPGYRPTSGLSIVLVAVGVSVMLAIAGVGAFFLAKTEVSKPGGTTAKTDAYTRASKLDPDQNHRLILAYVEMRGEDPEVLNWGRPRQAQRGRFYNAGYCSLNDPLSWPELQAPGISIPLSYRGDGGRGVVRDEIFIIVDGRVVMGLPVEHWVHPGKRLP